MSAGLFSTPPIEPTRRTYGRFARPRRHLFFQPPPPESTANARKVMGVVKRLMDPAHWELLWMRIIDGLTVEQVATKLGSTAADVRQLEARARLTCRQLATPLLGELRGQ